MCCCDEPEDEASEQRNLNRTVDLIACEVVGHKVRVHAKPQGGSMFAPNGKPADHVWRWVTCDRCGAHVAGEIPETYMDQAAREMSRRAADAMFGQALSGGGIRFWDDEPTGVSRFAIINRGK